jgi:dipeptidyl aminopeptidase/acylaminoacyl peptidase
LKTKTTPYGSWKSPITADLVASSAIRLDQIEVEKNNIYWSEMRPSEKGRNVIVKHSHDGNNSEVNQPPFNARTRVHEYGGGAYKVNQDTVYFTNFNDQRLYKTNPNEAPTPITPIGKLRYADFTFDNHRNRIICIREEQQQPSTEPANTIISVNLEGEDPKIIAAGNNFYSSPRISPDGKHLAWITWNHPNMPWDQTQLWTGRLTKNNTVQKPERIAGDLQESITQPQWSPDNTLFFISDRNGWWNLYSWKENRVKPVYQREAEFTNPPWTFAQSNYAFESNHKIVCSYTRRGEWHLTQLDAKTGEQKEVKTPYTQISNLKAANGYAVFIGGSPQKPTSIVKLDLKTQKTTILRESSNIQVDPDYLSKPTPIEFPTENGLTAHAIHYKPKNKEYTAPQNTKPPLLVMVHSGPTAQTTTILSWAIQFWTSRGFTVIDVNYGGSTGYGRAYRQRLNGKWGIIDVDDCINAAEHLVHTGNADPNKLAIRGGSAGGYTTINALTFRNLFKAGASYYGISDLKALTKDTHKFESRYFETLVGPYPEREDLYHNRSAINFLDKLQTPMILFQGLEDKIVPPNQAQLIVNALRRKGCPVAYLTFEGEQHGFRQAENIKRSLEAELYFYSKIFKFELAEKTTPIEIENL